MTRRSYATLDRLTGRLASDQVPDPGDGPSAPHPDGAEHVALGLVADTDPRLSDARSPTVHGHPDPADMATDQDLATHAATAHGLTSHAIDGAFHSGTSVLPTAGQKNALAGTSGTPGTGNEYVTTQDVRNTNARTPSAHAHLDGDIPAGIARDTEVTAAVSAHEAAGNPHATYATDADLTAHAAGPHGGGGAWTTVIKTADESKNSLAVVADDATLKFTTLPNTQYTVRLLAFFLTNATADLKYRLVHTGTTTRVRRRVKRTATTDIAQTIELKTAFDVADVILATTGLNPWLEEDIVLQVGAAGGVFKLQWAQVTSNAGPTTCLEGSYLEYALS